MIVILTISIPCGKGLSYAGMDERVAFQLVLMICHGLYSITGRLQNILLLVPLC